MSTELKKQGNDASEQVCADYEKASSTYSRMHLNFFIFVLLIFVLLLVIKTCYRAVAGQDMSSFSTNILNFTIMYLCVFPIFVLLCRPLEKRVPEKHKLPIWMPVLLFFATEAIMGIGNFIGLGVNFLLSQMLDKNTNSIEITSMLIGEHKWVFVALAVVGAPIVEELMCRKLLLDRIGKYGEFTAMIVSGVLFGLLHGNFVQFFYAALMGVFFAFIYLRTGNVLYTILLHFLVNFFGSAVPLIAVSGISPELQEIMLKVIASRETDEYKALVASNPGVLKELAPFLLYGTLTYVFMFIGLVLLIAFRKQIKTQPAAEPVAKGQRMKAAFINVGFLLFFAASVAEFILQLAG